MYKWGPILQDIAIKYSPYQSQHHEVNKTKNEENLLGTTDVTWKPILTTIPEVLLAAYNANIA